MASERLVWFITRPERDPKFHEEAIIALNIATNGFTLKWAGNREVHKKYEKELANLGVKRQNISADGSGGRTWMAMLRTFAYCYIDDLGFIKITKSGESILNGREVYKNIRKQILTLQYPNAYFLEKGFRPKFSESFRLRPVRFLIRMVNQEVLNYFVTKEEITYFVMTAQKDDQIQEITEKIIKFREASTEQKELMKQKIAAECDHRERSDKGARDFYTAHSDVAHTFMLISDFTEMVEYIRGKALTVKNNKREELIKELDELDQRYPFNKRYLISLQRMAENNGLDINSFKASSYNDLKPATNIAKLQMKIKGIVKNIPDPSSLGRETLLNELNKSLPLRDAEKVADSFYKSRTYTGLNQDFVENYLSETDDHEFELKTGNVFEALGFDVSHKPKALNGERTEIDIMVTYKDYFGIIDAKNYRKNKFALSASLASHMASEYIPNYYGYKNKRMLFYGYVTANEFNGIKNLEKISKLTERNLQGLTIDGIVLNAKTLLGFLDHCIENELKAEQRVSLFFKAVKNRGYVSIDEFLKEVYKDI